MREMKNAMKVKPVTSTAIDRPIGMPRRNKPSRLARCGGLTWPCRPNEA